MVGRDETVEQPTVGKDRPRCSEKANHTGILRSDAAKQRMEFYPGQLPPGVEDLLWDSDLLD